MNEYDFLFALWCESNFDIITNRFPLCISKHDNKYYNINELHRTYKCVTM